ncbi:MAG TPA: HDIG domain-containing metalloprotein [Solirubrobacteraceae bacterium]
MSDGLQTARSVLGDSRAWLVGGAVRDRRLGRVGCDLDLVIDGDPSRAARAVANAAGAACFALSEAFGAWRVVARGGAWQIDIERLRGGTLEADLALRDFTVNAVAEPLQGGAPIDPLGGLEDLAARRLRLVSAHVFADDPLRVLRLVRVAVELGLDVDEDALKEAARAAGDLTAVAFERIFMELRRIVGAEDPIRGLELMAQIGATAVVLPELEALRGVEQSRYHHRDVYGHTLEVLEQVLALTTEPAAVLGVKDAEAVQLFLAEPLGDGLTRGQALRWGALLHDAAKPATRSTAVDGRVTFIDHDRQGAQLARALLGRLRASTRLQSHLASLVEHHLRLGFLVHEPQPLSRSAVYRYLRACEPVEVDVTLLSVADRLATRGDRAEESIDAHMRLAGELLHDALDWRTQGPPQALLPGDELIRQVGLAPGPQVGEILEALREARYTGEITSREQALSLARSLHHQAASR